MAPDRHAHLLDPRAVHQVERRLRGLGQPPRSATEMAEWLRRLGDLAPSDLEGPMAVFLAELEADGRAARLDLPRVPRAGALGAGRGGGAATGRRSDWRASGRRSSRRRRPRSILSRFLRTHALVGLRDVLARYPFEEAWARRKLEEWSESGRLVVLPASEETEPLRWSAPDNLEQVQRGSLAILRREVLTCAPPQFVDFVLRWQGVHPATRRGEAAGLAEVLERLQGLPLPAELWEQTVLPARVPGYQPRWLDEATAGGEWTWACQGGDSGAGSLAFFRRETLLDLAAPSTPDAPPLDPTADAVLESLRARGASFVTDLAQQTGKPPSAVRAALWSLLRRGLVTNDHFDVVRKGEERAGPTAERGAAQRNDPRLACRLPASRASAPSRRALVAAAVGPARSRRRTPSRMASLLLNRYGIVARELALLDPWMPPWRVLYEVLSRMELGGEVRRGYFVEGLSGAQFALPEAMTMLQELHLPSTAAAPVVLLHSLDPANLYGSGAPLDVPLLDGGTRPLTRRAGNWLTLRAGRPVLLDRGAGQAADGAAQRQPRGRGGGGGVPAGHPRRRPGRWRGGTS